MKKIRKIVMSMLLVVMLSVNVQASSVDINKEIMSNYTNMTKIKYYDLMDRIEKLDFEEKQILKTKLESVKKYRGLVSPSPINKNIGYVNGRGEGFEPNANITRAEVAAILSRIYEDRLETNPVELKVNDYKNKWYTKDVQYCLDTGLLLGRGKGFEPNANITRAEMATILKRLHSPNLPTNPVELKVNDYKNKWYTKDVQYCLDTGLLLGRGKSFEPDANVTRAEMVKAINTLIPLDDIQINYSNEFIDVLPSKWYYNDIMIASNILPEDIKKIKINQ